MARFDSARLTRLIFAVLLVSATAALAPLARDVSGDDQDDEIQKDEAKRRKERYTNWMRDYSKDTTVRVKMPGDDDEATADLVPTPVFRYSSQVIADDATLWIWTRDARPVALQKVEVNNFGGGRMWTICFGSVSEGLVNARWPGARRYSATQPGVTYRPIPGAEAPGEKARSRTAQLKILKGRFTGVVDNGDGKGGTEMKAITTPLYEYSDKDSKLLLGAIFSMVDDKGNVNPGFLLLIEARPDGDGKWRWEYGGVRLGTGGVLLRLDDAEVWRQGPVAVTDQIHDNWTFYFMRRDFE